MLRAPAENDEAPSSLLSVCASILWDNRGIYETIQKGGSMIELNGEQIADFLHRSYTTIDGL